jgi:hypothetical protein
MTKTIFSKVMWVGRATVFLVGLAVILALVFGVASTALGANGKPFLLGKKNTASKVSKLVKSGIGPALDLRVGSGPPLAVNSSERVANLNADKVDGQDSSAFLPVGGKAADSDLLDGQEASAFLGAGATAADSDKLDGKDSGELPGAVVQAVNVTGEGSTVPFGSFSFVGPPVTVTTSSTQRLVGVVSAPLKLDSGGPLDFNYGLCYRAANTNNPLVNFSGPNHPQGTATTTPVWWTAAATRTPGVANTWEVGFCAANTSNQFVTLRGAGRVSGWIEVVNPTP